MLFTLKRDIQTRRFNLHALMPYASRAAELVSCQP